MPLDPNWFYSTLAQCGAAIVGLLGGVLVTRLQRQIAEAQEKRRPFEQWRDSLRSVLQECVADLMAYERELDDLLRRAEESLNPGIEPATLPIRKVFPSRRGTIVHDNETATPALLESQRARRTTVMQVRTHFENMLKSSSTESLRQSWDSLQRLAASAGTDEAAIISDHPARVQAVLETGHQLRNTSAAAASLVVLAVLVVLCVSGILIPLGFLSARDCSSKFALLGSFSVGIIALLGYIAYQINELGRIGNTGLSR